MTSVSEVRLSGLFLSSGNQKSPLPKAPVSTKSRTETKGTPLFPQFWSGLPVPYLTYSLSQIPSYIRPRFKALLQKYLQ